MKVSQLALALPGLLLVAGCAEPGTRSTYYSESPVSGPVSTQAAADRSLETRTRSDLNRSGDLSATTTDIGINARSGYVTLTGTVPAEKDRQMIGACVRNTPGVVSVNDQLQVGYAATDVVGQSAAVYAPAAPPAVEVTTPAPAPAYTEQKTVVTTTTPSYTEPVRPAPPPSGTVYTGGTTADIGLQAQASVDPDRDLADRIAENVRSDPVIPTLAPSVTITVTGGRAYVTGSVESGRQHRVVIDAVKRTPGVVDVVDRLQVR
jgi:osmotically-inducible protein OsmY